MRSRYLLLLAIAAVCVTTASAEWTSEALVTGSQKWRSLYQDYAHKAVFGTDGVGHLAWSGGSPNQGYSGVWYNRYSPGSGGQPGLWGSDFALAPLITKPRMVGHADPCIALDGDGRTIHAVWHSRVATSFPDYPDSVCYRICTQDRKGNNKWGPVVHLYAAKYISGPGVACAPNEPNRVFVCWRHLVEIDSSHNSRVTRFREYVNGAWTAVVVLDSSDGPSGRASIAAASNGDVFVAYPGYDEGTTGTQILVKTRHNGTWGQPVNVTRSFSSIQYSRFTVEVNPATGNPHVVFERSTEVPSGEGLDTVHAVCHTFRNASGDWLTAPELVSAPDTLFRPHLPSMAFLSNGAAYVVWSDTLPPTNSGIMCSSCSNEGGTWSTPEWLTSYPCGAPSLAVEEARSALHLFWVRSIGDYHDQIWWKSNYLGGGGGQGQPMTLSQSGIELFPNPTRDGCVTMQYALPHAGPIAVTLLDVSGRAVRTQEVAANRSGSVSIDASGLRAGVYVVKLESGTSSQTRKLVIQ